MQVPVHKVRRLLRLPVRSGKGRRLLLRRNLHVRDRLSVRTILRLPPRKVLATL